MSCLFDSLAYYISDVTSDELRRMICDYIATNPTIFENEDTLRVSDVVDAIFSHHQSDLHVYVNEMRKTSTWGSGLEIKSFCDLFGVEVHVYYTGNLDVPIIFYPNRKRTCSCPPDTTSPKFCLRYNGVHYDPYPEKC